MSPVAVRKQERCDDSDVKGIRSEEAGVYFDGCHHNNKLTGIVCAVSLSKNKKPPTFSLPSHAFLRIQLQGITIRILLLHLI
jgi:hypothetical protein